MCFQCIALSGIKANVSLSIEIWTKSRSWSKRASVGIKPESLAWKLRVQLVELQKLLIYKTIIHFINIIIKW